MWRHLTIVVLVAVISLVVFWLPFLVKTEQFWGIEFGAHGTEILVQNFDGLNYIAVAKTLYDPELLERDFASFGNPPIYYAAHFPLYPLLIRGFDTVVTAPQALLLSTMVSNILLAIGLYVFFATLLTNKRLALILAIIALFFPARMLSVRSVGSSEPLFIFFVLASLAQAYRGKHVWGAILGSLAVLTRSPGIFLFAAYAVAWLMDNGQWSMKIKKTIPYLLMPLALTLLFAWYAVQYGNFWAYFANSRELHPVLFPPFLAFSNTARWISDMWREDVLYLYVFYGIGIAMVHDRWSMVKKWGMLWGLILLCVAHRDLARYALPIAPVALMGFAPYVSVNHAKWLLLLLVPMYLLGWQFVLGNVQPVSDWTNLL